MAQVNLLPDTFGICAGDISKLEITKKLDPSAKIIWNDPYMGIIEFSKQIPVVKPGKYKVKVTIGKNIIYDSTIVLVNNKPRINFKDTTLCKGNPFFIDARNNGMRYTWNTGETSQRIKVENSGTYWVKINNRGCIQSDTINVKFLQGSTTNFNNEITFCFSDENKILNVKTAPNTKIQWSTGSIYPSINVTKDGIYWVKTENKSCGEQIDSVMVKLKACDCEMIIPDSFTPNEDNKNDYFFPVFDQENAENEKYHK
jgi:hypothetical protein